MGKIPISELDPEQQERIRVVNREYKRKQRAEERFASRPYYEMWADNWSIDFPTQYVELKSHQKSFSEHVATELCRTLTDTELETLSWVSVTHFCFGKNSSPWVREVRDPDGLHFGGLFFADVIGEDLVANTHRFKLESSATYSTTYRELLTLLDKTFGKNTHGEEGASARAVKQELAGEFHYVPPPAPVELKQEPPKRIALPVPVTQVPSDREIMLQESEKLIRQLAIDNQQNNPNFWVEVNRPRPELADEARRYLDGA